VGGKDEGRVAGSGRASVGLEEGGGGREEEGAAEEGEGEERLEEVRRSYMEGKGCVLVEEEVSALDFG
jgi:hypothetical protein